MTSRAAVSVSAGRRVARQRPGDKSDKTPHLPEPPARKGKVDPPRRDGQSPPGWDGRLKGFGPDAK